MNLHVKFTTSLPQLLIRFLAECCHPYSRGGRRELELSPGEAETAHEGTSGLLCSMRSVISGRGAGRRLEAGLSGTATARHIRRHWSEP